MARIEYKDLDDDGKRQRAWVINPKERCRTSCERTIKVLSAHSWISEIRETEKGDDDDIFGIDIFMKVDKKLLSAIGVWTEGLIVPVQVKSSEHEQRKFKSSHREHIFNLGKGDHIFVLDGQDALDVINADLVGQMIYLSYLASKKERSEEEFLRFLVEEMGDRDIVERYLENREIVLEAKWYGKSILDMKK